MSYTIVTTAASVTQLVSEVPNVAADSIVNAVLGNKDIPRSYIADTRYGLNHLVGNKFYNYGKSSYINGLPTSKYTQEFPDDVQDLTLAAINTKVPVPAVALVSMKLTTPKEHFLM